MKIVFLLFLCLFCQAEEFGLKWTGMKAVTADDGSLLLEDASTTGGAYIISEALPVDINQPWSVSVEARCEEIRNGRAQVYVRTFDAAGKIVNHFASNSITGTRGWTKLSITIPVKKWKPNITSLRILLQPAAGPADATGKAWFRNLRQGLADPAMLNPAPWNLSWEGAVFSIEDGIMKIEDATTTGGPYIVSSNILIDAAKSYRLSLEARCEDVKIGRTQAYISAYDKDGKRLAMFPSNRIQGTKDWTRLTVDVPANKWPKGTHHIKYMIQPACGPAEATGTAWFKNLTGTVLEMPVPITGRESTGEYVFKYANISLLNKRLKAFPFERPPISPRLEIMTPKPIHTAAIQILTEEELGATAQYALWIEGKEDYSELKPVPLKKVPRGYLLDIVDFPVWRKLALVFPEKKTLLFEDIQVSRPIFPEEDWKANWIWFTRDRVEMINVHLRKEFELKNAPVKAMWQCAADDGAIVFFNGKRQPNVDGRFTPPNEDIARKLHAGKNIITVEVQQGRYAAGFLAELDLYFADGSFQKVMTDKSWKYFPSDKEIRASQGKSARVPVPANWHAADYDSSALGNCIELGVPPLGGWGAIKYHMNAPRLPITLKTPAYSDTLEAGKTYHQKVTFSPQTPCKDPTPIRLQLMRDGTTFLEWEIGVAPAGKSEFTLPFSFSLSPFLHPGIYQMRMVISGYQAQDTNGKPCDLKNVTVLNTRHADTPTAKIQRDSHGVPTLTINGKPYASVFSARGPSFLNQHGALFGKAGLHLYHVYLTPHWPTPDTASFTRMDSIAENLLSSDPKAKFIVRIQLRDGKPSWYLSKYPNEAVTFENGAKANHVSLASQHWKQFAGKYLRGLVKHVADSPYADHCIGFIASEGEEGQWMHYWGGGDPAAPGTLSDYSPVMLDYFRKWLKREYKTDAALQKAWNDPKVTLETATIPTRQERCDGTMQFRNLPQNRKAMDFGWALSDVISEGIVFYAKTIKEASGGKALTGALYGHLMDLGGQFLGEQVGYARQKLAIETPYIDFYLGPISYSHRFRDIGYPGGYDMPSPGTLELHNKIWINEDDLRTHLQFPAEYAYSVRTPAQLNQQMARELIKAICARAGFYYFSLKDKGMRWFDDPETIEDIKVLTQIGDRAVTADRRSTSEIALFFDDEAQCRLHQLKGGAPFNVNSNAIMQREAIFRIGAPSDEFVQFDIANPGLKSYKLYVFLNPYYLKEEQIAAIEKLAKQPGVVLLFASTPGVAGDQGLDTSVTKRLTGMDFLIETNARPNLFATARAFGKLPAGTAFGSGEKQFRAIRPVSGYDEVLATFKGSDAPAVVRKGNVFLSVMPDLPVELLQEIADKAQVYLYSRDAISIYACRQYLGFHSSKEKKACTFRAPAGKRMRQIWPVIPNPKTITVFQWENQKPETRMFEVMAE